MTIIKHGRPTPPKYDMIEECPNCRCVFTFTENESKKTSNNGGGFVYDTKCPECGNTGCYFDTGYPNDPIMTRKVMERQERLRGLITPAI